MLPNRQKVSKEPTAKSKGGKALDNKLYLTN